MEKIKKKLPKYINFCGRVYCRMPKGDLAYPTKDSMSIEISEQGVRLASSTMRTTTDIESMPEYRESDYREITGSICIPGALWSERSKTLLTAIVKRIVVLKNRGVLTTAPIVENGQPIDTVFASKLNIIIDSVNNGNIAGAYSICEILVSALANMREVNCTLDNLEEVWSGLIQFLPQFTLCISAMRWPWAQAEKNND